MVRALLNLALLVTLVAAGAVAVAWYQRHTALDRELAGLRDRNQSLHDAIDRLTAERRVAELLVTDRHPGPDGVPRVTILMQEYDGRGTPLPPARFELVGGEVHLDATVIRFDRGLVEENDPLRGHSITLFTRIYGDHQRPVDGAAVDGPARIGELDRGTDPRVTAFERDLWSRFWHLADDPAYRKAARVDAAFGQGVWFSADPDQLYTVTVQADGGLNLTGEPIQGIYRDALRPPPP